MRCVWLALAAAVVTAAPTTLQFDGNGMPAHQCPGGFQLTESIPVGVDFTPDLSTHDAWLKLVNGAQKTIDIAAYYMTLTEGANYTTGGPGVDIYNAILAAGLRGIDIRIVVNIPTPLYPQTDVLSLVDAGAVDAVFINFTSLSPELAGGILHTKFLIADDATFYVGSANMDWRALTEVKEFGVYFPYCPVAASDLGKIFETYLLTARNDALPSTWPSYLQPFFNQTNPGTFSFNGSQPELYFSFSPPPMRAPGWTADQDAIITNMALAQKSISFEMMDFLPGIMYSPPLRYWPVIDDAIRAIQFTNPNVSIRILIGYWNNSFPQQWQYLTTLNALSNVEVRYFIVPPVQPAIPYTRVNHAKWMVTDQAFYVDTSNWVGDYFITTAGVGLTMSNSSTIVAAAAAVFERDWTSVYSMPLPDAPPEA